jgi:hypothetical protein
MFTHTWASESMILLIGALDAAGLGGSFFTAVNCSTAWARDAGGAIALAAKPMMKLRSRAIFISSRAAFRPKLLGADCVIVRRRISVAYQREDIA